MIAAVFLAMPYVYAVQIVSLLYCAALVVATSCRPGTS